LAACISPLENQLRKPVIPINAGKIWRTFRSVGIDDKFTDKGWLLEKF
jgi:maleate cis-trans isomerase